MLQVIRSSLPLLALLIAASWASADEPKPNTLTPKEAAEGWLLLFDGETTFGWTTLGDANVKDGVLSVGGKTPAEVQPSARFGDEFEVKFRCRGRGAIQCGHDSDGVPMTFKFGPKLIAGSNWAEFAYRVGGKKPEFSLINTSVSITVDRGTRHRGWSFAVQTIADSKVEITDVKIRPLGFKPLFNGKDLTGWTVFPDPKRQQAKFSVTPGGELHVLGGPGDLQTTKKYSDFVLQTEVKTNGPMVNSGLFFRCIPGQYQNGYEVQIQNGFKDGNRTKPTDGGTGAIYRRQAARKVVPNDKEWFTLTVIASGPHLATWVNGYPTASWTDERKPHENPRNGLRTEAGHISIQGHNPPMSADVLFRNLRIAEMKTK